MPTECGGDSPSTPPSPYSWKTWFDLEKGLSSDIINHFVFETFSQTYSIFDQNRELIDHFVAKLSSKTKIEVLTRKNKKLWRLLWAVGIVGVLVSPR